MGVSRMKSYVQPLTIVATIALFATALTPVLAVENAPSNTSDLESIPIASKLEGPSDYPAGAAEKGEHGTAIIMI